MKKYGIGLFGLFILLFSGCSIDYDTYYQEYGDVKNKEYPDSYYIEDEILSHPLDNSELIEKYGEVYHLVEDDYEVYASYYSNVYDTLYISYDNINDRKQTINTKNLMMMEEHLLNYFTGMDEDKSDYKEYLKVVRVYPDYHSSTCRDDGELEESYSRIEGCAHYNAIEASINLNNLTSIDRFYNPHTYVEGEYQYYTEPKRDTFAHEYGHVSTYYYLTLKGDDSYEDYLRIRLGQAYDELYENGMPNEYTDATYYIDPVEILADDYVELFYNTSQKNPKDYYEYDLSYNDLRNSLSQTNGVIKKLSEDQNLKDNLREYYSLLTDSLYDEYDEKFVVTANGITYNTMHDIASCVEYIDLDNKDVVVVGEVTIEGNEYYRVVLSNFYKNRNPRREYSDNLGYILKANCVTKNNEVIKFNKYNGEIAPSDMCLVIDTYFLVPHYEFSHFIVFEDKVLLYNYLENNFITKERDFGLFS